MALTASNTLLQLLSVDRPLADESELIRRMLAGEQRAFDAFFDGHFGRLFRFALPRLGGDVEATREVVQSTLGKAMRKLSHYRGEAALFTWLYQITLNECRAKQRNLRPTLNFDDCDDSSQAGSTPEASAVEKIALERTLDSLSPPLRVALVLREMHGLSYEEIAHVLRLPVGTVRSRLHKARHKFQEIWERE
jgi:RNA polymerase sigma-70 factor (ECF subfamily)